MVMRMWRSIEFIAKYLKKICQLAEKISKNKKKGLEKVLWETRTSSNESLHDWLWTLVYGILKVIQSNLSYLQCILFS